MLLQAVLILSSGRLLLWVWIASRNAGRARRVRVLLSWSPLHGRGSRSKAQLGVIRFSRSALPGGGPLAREMGFVVQTVDLIRGCLKMH